MRPLAEVGRALFMIVVLSAEAAIGVFGPDWESPTMGSSRSEASGWMSPGQVNRIHRNLLKFPNPNNQGTEAI
jgi:hypothetical protein